MVPQPRNPDDGQFSLNWVCARLNYTPEAWTFHVRRYLKNPRRHAIVPLWRRLDEKDVVNIRHALKKGERPRQIAQRYRPRCPTLPSASS